jgi:hypothetical protein
MSLFHMEVERMEHLYVRVQQQELRLYKLEHHDGIPQRKAKQVCIDDLKIDRVRGQ